MAVVDGDPHQRFCGTDGPTRVPKADSVARLSISVRPLRVILGSGCCRLQPPPAWWLNTVTQIRTPWVKKERGRVCPESGGSVAVEEGWRVDGDTG